MSGLANGDAARESNVSEAPADEHAAKRQRLESAANDGGLADGEVTRVAAQGPAACYICRLANVPGKFRPDKVGRDLLASHVTCCCRLTGRFGPQHARV